MSRRAPLVVLAAFGGALVPLLLLDGPRRSNGWRLYGVALGLLALRAIIELTVDAGAPPVGSPFHRPRRLPERWRRHTDGPRPRRTAADQLVRTGLATAGGFHTQLRPVLRRLAADLDADTTGLEPLLAADRPAPDDRRAPGIGEDELRAVLLRLEEAAP